jgi:hypothetical protein
MPDYWEWACDYCGKTTNTNSQTTRPPGWVPRGRTVGKVPDFCSEEHQTAYNTRAAEQPDKSPDAPAPAEVTPAEAPQDAQSTT